MRRLAGQSRKDTYSSLRDYQEVFEERSLRITPRGRGRAKIVLSRTTDAGNTGYIGAGGFLWSPKATEVIITVRGGDRESSRPYELLAGWNRFGLAVESDPPEVATLEIEWSGGTPLMLWGVTADGVELPEVAMERVPSIETLQQDHLAPETFYFDHGEPLGMDFDDEASSRIVMGTGPAMYVKKCAYCGRMLPVEPTQPGRLSFHGHRAKTTGHQNECRACKKWRINDSFNPIRTVDQLHESSVITRERRMFLREPQILQEIKDRTAIGLKTIVWERFGRACFYCGRPLRLEDVQLDHTRPMAYLWPIDQYATCLCPEHNNLKKAKFPVEFYNDSQLERLSEITGLPLEELKSRSLNKSELERILSDLPDFAREWEPRHFAATARKIKDLRPDVDLFDLLNKRDRRTYEWLMKRLHDRPDPVGEIVE